MEMERIIGALFSGFMCRVYAAGTAIWVASEAASYITRTMGEVSKGFGG